MKPTQDQAIKLVEECIIKIRETKDTLKEIDKDLARFLKFEHRQKEVKK